MDIKAALAKVKESDGGDDIAKAIEESLANNAKALELAQKAVKDAEGKAAAILADKKKAQEKLGELETRLEDIESSGLSDAEKIKKDAEKAEARAAKAEKALSDLQANFESERRNNALSQIGRDVKFLDTVPSVMQQLALEKAFENVKDLSDEDAVKQTLATFKESHSGLLAADSAPAGGGTKAGTRTAGGNGTFTREQIANMTPEQYAENRAAIFEQMAAGKIKGEGEQVKAIAG